MMGTEEVLTYLLTVQSVLEEILHRALAPSLPVSGPGTILCVLYCQTCHSGIISYLSLQEKDSNAVITHNAMAFWTLFILKLHRSSCFTSSLVPLTPFIQSWFHYPGCCITHRATHECWLPMTLSPITTVNL